MTKKSGKRPQEGEAFDDFVARRREKRMATFDQLPADTRKLVHEYGYTVVRACLDLGVVKPAHIRHLVETVLNEFSPTRGTYSQQGIRTNVVEEITQ